MRVFKNGGLTLADSLKEPRRFLRKLSTAQDLELDFLPHTLAIQETPPSPFTRVVLWTTTLLMMSLVGWSCVSTIPINTSAPAKFQTDARTKVVQSLNSGTVIKILVKDGQSVHKDQPLIELDSLSDRAALASQFNNLSLNTLQRRRIRAELSGRSGYAPVASAATDISKLETGVMRADLAHLRSQIGSDQHQIKEAQANLLAGVALLEEYTQRVALDRKRVAEAAPLVPIGAMSGTEFDQLRTQGIEDRGDLAKQTQQIGQLREAVEAARAQLAIDKTGFVATQYQALESVQGKDYDIESQYVAAKQQYRHDWLRSPVDGRVQDLNVASLGAVIQPGQTLATVVPNDAPLVVAADLAVQSAGFVKVGQRVRIKVTAYPFEQYGTIPGHVTWISPTAETQSTIGELPAGENHEPAIQAPPPSLSNPGANESGTPAPPTLYYQVHVRPDRNWLRADGAVHRLYPGMTATVDIHTGKRRVIEFFLDPIVKYLDNGLGTR